MLVDIVRQTIQRHSLFSSRGVLVAVSGGPDSVALLDVLLQLRPELKLRLHVAHLNHQLRPEADEEAEFVRELATDRGLPVTVESAEVRALAARDKVSLEVAGRNARREFLRRTARSVGREVRIATGHHADDRAETILMRLLRGTGVDGLRGMQAWQWPFVRPLFDVTRAQIEDYVRARGLPYREDASNRDPAFLRNRIRWELLPLLDDLQPGARRALLRLSDLAGDDALWMNTEAAMSLIKVTDELADSRKMVEIRLSSFGRIMPRAQRRRTIRVALRCLLGHTMDAELEHIEAVLRLADHGKTGAALHLPHDIVAERGYGKLILRRRKAPSQPAEPVGEYALAQPGETEIPPLSLTITAQVLARAQAPEMMREPATAAQLDYGVMDAPLILRTWRRGDRFQPLGMAGTTKVHDFFVNQKVPRGDRARVPIITCGDRIAWIVGHRVDERFKVTAATTTVLRLQAQTTPAGGVASRAPRGGARAKPAARAPRTKGSS